MKDNKRDNIQNDIIKGILEIKTKSKIKNINKSFLSDKLIIEEEKNDKYKNSFIMKYNYEIDLIQEKQGGLSFGYLFGKLSSHKLYIPASKLLFDFESNNALFYQNSLKNKEEQSLIFNYKIPENKTHL